MRAVACVGLLTLSLVLTGCSLFKKSQAKASGGGLGDTSGIGQPIYNDRAGSPVDRAQAPPAVGGVLAGQVLDSYNRRPPSKTYIQVAASPDGKGQPAAVVDVPCNEAGYFTIPGLKPGQSYQLIARAKDGDRMLAGSAWVRPPNPKIVIRISEDLATASTPPLPSEPTWPGNKGKGVETSAEGGKAKNREAGETSRQGAPADNSSWGSGRDSAWASGPNNPSGGKPAEWRPPEERPGGSPPPSPGRAAPPAEGDLPPNVVDRGGRVPALGNINPQGPAPVPSCVLVGRQLHNFALNDLSGRPWEYRKDHKGRLTLLDFWGPECRPCINAIPHLQVLQQRYGPQGLEVIGIAYELENGPPNGLAQRVDRVRQKQGISYRLLLGTDRATCPVWNQFGAQALPTLALIDDKDEVIWIQEGFGPQEMHDLDRRISSRLSRR